MNENFTDEQLRTIRRVTDEYEQEFRKWSKENKEHLDEWYETNKSYPTTFQTLGQYAYYCANEFLKFKEGKIEED